jgi:hypothetical protein
METPKEGREVHCADCTHFRSAPYEARIEGCYFPGNMPAKQKQDFLDEQQIPGDHRVINRRHDCPDFEARPAKPSFWRRLLSLDA